MHCRRSIRSLIVCGEIELEVGSDDKNDRVGKSLGI